MLVTAAQLSSDFTDSISQCYSTNFKATMTIIFPGASERTSDGKNNLLKVIITETVFDNEV